MIDVQTITTKATQIGMSYIPKLVAALLTLIIGWIIIKLLVRVLRRAMRMKRLDFSLQKFLENLTETILKVLLAITVIGMLGVQTTSFIAILGAAGLAIGLALQGSLANFAGGVLILIFKPFKIGDVIQAQGFTGSVKEIQVFNTILNTLDNQKVIIPNGALSNGPITNLTTEPKRRVDMVFGCGYEDDLKKAEKVLLAIVSKHPKVLKDPAPTVRVSELADSSVNFVVRPWCKTEDYWTVYFDITEQVKINFDKHKISIPYPQRDVHMKK